MKKVLIIAYQFPPRGGPGVHRTLNLVKYLRENGYEPIVLTIDDHSLSRSKAIRDQSLLNEIPSDLKIVRTPSNEPFGFVTTMMKFGVYRIFWNLFFPLLWETSVAWNRIAFDHAKKLIIEQSIELIYTTSGPFSSLLIGRKLKRSLNVKWVADLRDPYTDGYAWAFPTKLHWLLMRCFERYILSIPDTLIVNTDAVLSLYHKRGIRKGKRTVVINNGH